jgi:capsular exopolysaccharide synthesis family protein
MASSSGPVPIPLPGTVPYVPASPVGEVDRGGFNLQSLVRILRRRKGTFLVTLLAVTAGFGVHTAWKRIYAPVYQGGFRLLVSDPVNDPGSQGGGGREAGTDIASVARNVSRIDLPTLMQVLESPTVLEPVFTELSRLHPDQKLPMIDVGLVSADPTQRNPILASGVLSVTARGRDPEMVQRALRLTEKAYLSWSLRQRREKLSEGVRFLDEQAPVLQDRARQIQLEVERFRQRNNVLLPQEEAASVRSQIEQLRSRLLSQQTERNQLLGMRADVAAGRLATRSFSSQAGSGSGSGSAGPSSSSTGTGTNLGLGVPDQALLDELARLDQEIAQARSTYRGDAPFLRNLIAARDALKPRLQSKELDAVDAALERNQAEIGSTRGQIARLENRFGSQATLLREYDDLNRKLELAQGNLASFLSTRDQFQLEIAQNNVPWKVIAPSFVDPNPVDPRLGRGLLQGLLVGLVAGAGAALLRDRLDHVFHTPGEVREELHHPVLGHIPYIAFFEGVRSDKRFLLKELDSQEGGLGGYERFHYQEAFRNLYTSLRFLSSDRPVRSVALSSSIPAEGKSLAIVLLAKTLSELGQKVLLVDADLRKPQVHHRLGLENLEGLSTLLAQEGRSWRQLIQKVPDYPNWDVLVAGRVAPDPPRLLSSQRMGHLVKEIASEGGYDLILYDTPPALGLADAALVAEHLDGILLLVSLNRVDRTLPAEALRRIESAGAPVLGVVTNSRSRTEAERSAYGYGSYEYGTGGSRSNPSALDTSMAYAYYRKGAEPREAEPKGAAALVPNRRNLSRWGKSVRRWLEGS